MLLNQWMTTRPSQCVYRRFFQLLPKFISSSHYVIDALERFLIKAVFAATLFGTDLESILRHISDVDADLLGLSVY